jgi:hypothetical protein
MWEANVVEKRITGIVRWLERCLKAYRTGALESALMDAECARADIELLRDDVWKKLERQYAAKPRKGSVCLWLRLPTKVAFLAMVVVLAAATPVALFENAPQRERTFREGQNSLTLEWVTPDEQTLLSNLRKHLSDANSFASIQRAGETIEKPVVASKTPSPEPTAQAIQAIQETPEVAELQKIPYDRILSLVQTGEKAMKQQASIITIER